MKAAVSLAFLAFLLSISCASPPAAPLDTQGIAAPDFGQSQEIPEGMGRLVIGRSSSTSVPGGGFEIQINGKHIASVDNGSYVQLYAEAGTYEAKMGWSVLGSPFYIFSQTIIIEAGKTGYLEWRHAGLSSGKLATFAQFPQLNYGRMQAEDPYCVAIYLDGSTVARGGAVHSPLSASPRSESAVAGPGSDADEDSTALDFDVPRGTSILSKNAIAIVIGNRDYRHGTSPVKFALNDAAAFRETLLRSFGIDPNDLWYYRNAGLADMISLFGGEGGVKSSRIYRTASLRDTPADVIIYYSGHGAPSTSGTTKGKGYLLPVDADVLSIESTGYPIDLLLANIETMKGDAIVGRCWIAIDACFSGQSGDGSLLVKNVSGLAIVPAFPKEAPKDSVIMLASSGEEFASWYPEKRHGLFTYFLLKGLAGAADAKGDGSVSVAELSSYLQKWVPRFANGLNAQEQTPQVLESGEIGGFLKLKE